MGMEDMSPLKSNSVENFKNVLENLYRDKLYWGFKENVSWKSFDLYETFWRVEQLSVDVSNFDISFVSDFAILPFSSFVDKKKTRRKNERENIWHQLCFGLRNIHLFLPPLWWEEKNKKRKKTKQKTLTSVVFQTRQYYLSPLWWRKQNILFSFPILWMW